MASTTAKKKFTPRQQRVKDLLDEGKTPTEIAKVLRISTAGVNSHLRAIRRTTAANDSGNGTQATVGRVTNTIPNTVPQDANDNNGGSDIVARIRQMVDEGRARAESIDSDRLALSAKMKALDEEYAEIRSANSRHERALEVYEA